MPCIIQLKGVYSFGHSWWFDTKPAIKKRCHHSLNDYNDKQFWTVSPERHVKNWETELEKPHDRSLHEVVACHTRKRNKNIVKCNSDSGKVCTRVCSDDVWLTNKNFGWNIWSVKLQSGQSVSAALLVIDAYNDLYRSKQYILRYVFGYTFVIVKYYCVYLSLLQRSMQHLQDCKTWKWGNLAL